MDALVPVADGVEITSTAAWMRPRRARLGRMSARLQLERRLHLGTRYAASQVVGRLPLPLADALRRPVVAAPGARRRSAQDLLLGALRRAGIPSAAETFQLPDNEELSFVRADSLVLQQLYWFGERGWEPELLPWWRYFCTRSAAILELGANVGYYTVQGARAGPQARYVAVEPHPVSARVCEANLALNRIDSVQVIAAAAVSTADVGSVRLVIPWEQLATPTVAFLDDGSELPRRMADRTASVLDVPAVDVRSLLDSVDLVKIDAEGQEHALLQAAADHLRAARATVFVEVLPGTPRLRSLLVDLCGNAGYSCYVPVTGALVRLEPERIPGVMLKDEYGGQDVILSAEPDLPDKVKE